MRLGTVFLNGCLAAGFLGILLLACVGGVHGLFWLREQDPILQGIVGVIAIFFAILGLGLYFPICPLLEEDGGEEETHDA